ncbi:hypothetical protein [Methylosinus sp. LW4]|uniref:hypothetical protein n=1 Tax=Methylosinus sp. LW4 TaxID=136993 RepID=UPI000379366C|nr:hypothetical protein [Methylosinus sp. LW4]
MSQELKFKLKQIVKLVESGETGTVVGRAEFDYSNPSYLVRYKAGDGRQVESWWTESALAAA